VVAWVYRFSAFFIAFRFTSFLLICCQWLQFLPTYWEDLAILLALGGRNISGSSFIELFNLAESLAFFLSWKGLLMLSPAVVSLDLYRSIFPYWF
jgi:hypothetical protein